MKALLVLCRLALIIGLAVVLATPADAAVRSNLFGRSSRSMMGVGDGGQGELYTVTPGVKSFKAQLKGIGKLGYSGNGKRFSLSYSRNNPRSMSSPNGRMTFSKLRGGGMRMFVKSLRGAKIGKPMTVLPAGSLAERGGTMAPVDPFRFSGFDGARFTREQLLNDVGLFGSPLAKLVGSGLGSVNTFFQRIATAIAIQAGETPGVFDGQGPDFIVDTVDTASTGIVSDFTDPNAAQTILNSPVDLLALLDPLLRNLDLDNDGFSDLSSRQIAAIQKFIATNEDKLIEFLTVYGLRDAVQDEVDASASGNFTPVNPSSPGIIEFTDSVTSFLENAGSSFVYVSRKDGSLGEATAKVTLGPGTSPDSSIFRFAPQTVKWLPGESGPKPVKITIVDDRIEDGDQLLELAIETTTGASLGSLLYANVAVIDNDGEFTDSAIAVARNALLVLEYSWPRTQPDLDTFTTFEEGIITPTAGVGFTFDRSALFAPYMAWSGDDTTGGGKEVVVIDLDSAISDGLLSPFNIKCNADWYGPAGGQGPATLTVYFRDKVSAKISPKATAEIFPNDYFPASSSNDHADTHVADVDIQYEATGGTVEFTLTPIVPSP